MFSNPSPAPHRDLGSNSTRRLQPRALQAPFTTWPRSAYATTDSPGSTTPLEETQPGGGPSLLTRISVLHSFSIRGTQRVKRRQWARGRSHPAASPSPLPSKVRDEEAYKGGDERVHARGVAINYCKTQCFACPRMVGGVCFRFVRSTGKASFTVMDATSLHQSVCILESSK